MIGVRQQSSRDRRERATTKLPEIGWRTLWWPAPSDRGSIGCPVLLKLKDLRVCLLESKRLLRAKIAEVFA